MIVSEITENLEKLNSSIGQYNDIFYVTSSNNGTDITNKERKENYVNQPS